MTAFELYGTVGAIVCLLDSANHLDSLGELKDMIRLCHQYLDVGGLFVFDVNTPYKLEKIYGDNVFYVDTDDFTCIWQCAFDSSEQKSLISISLFHRKGTLYEKTEDNVVEKAWSVEDITKVCRDAGFIIEGIYNAFGFSPCHKESERVFFVLRKDSVKK